MGETKKCKHCQSEIDKKAKVCPNCRKKQSGKLTPIIIGIIVFGILISALNREDGEPKLANTDNAPSKTEVNSGKGTEDEETQSTADTDAEPIPTSFGIGDSVTLNDVLVTLVSVNEHNGADFFKPADGNVFLICEFNIENESDKDISVSSMLSFEAYVDDYAASLSITGLSAGSDKKQLDGSVASGKKMAGIVAYEVPSDWKEFEINFTPSFWSGKEISFITTK